MIAPVVLTIAPAFMRGVTKRVDCPHRVVRL